MRHDRGMSRTISGNTFAAINIYIDRSRITAATTKATDADKQRMTVTVARRIGYTCADIDAAVTAATTERLRQNTM